MELDLLAVGAGACGLVAAIAAHDGGLRTAVVEKLDRPGGNTALSTGSVPGAGSRFQAEAGIVDSPEALIADLAAIAGDDDSPAVTRTLAHASAGLVEWLVDRVGARIALITDYRHVGHSVPRLHAPRSRRGRDLLDDLLRAAAARAIPVAVGNPVVRLLADDRGIAGVEIGGARAPSRIRAGAVVLATNGFAANRALVAEFCPEIAGAEYFGALGSTGDAVTWGRALDAGLANMGAYQGYAAVVYPHGNLLSWTTIEHGGILVGADGTRFGDESAGYSGFAPRVLRQGAFAFALFDQRICEVAAREEEFAEMLAMGGVRRAETVARAAALFDLPAAPLATTVAAYDRAAAGAAPDAFGRTAFGHAPLVPPYYVARVRPGLFHTQGGLRVDARARVLDRAGSPIPGLYAGGGAAAGISGRQGAAGYASGNGLLTALGLGRIAGSVAAAERRGR
ncbi:MAG: FAD-binding protein [Alphaproteobacteria bacterium]|nr:FAD-binding protein [Alphaproteobacteria bacterium]